MLSAAPSASAMMALAPGLAQWTMSRPVERSESRAARLNSSLSSAVTRSVSVVVGRPMMLRVFIEHTLAQTYRDLGTLIAVY